MSADTKQIEAALREAYRRGYKDRKHQHDYAPSEAVESLLIVLAAITPAPDTSLAELVAALEAELAKVTEQRNRLNQHVFYGVRAFESLAQRFGETGREVSARWTREQRDAWKMEMVS